MKTIQVNEWQEEAFAVKMTASRIDREMAHGQSCLALRARVHRRLHAANRAIRKALRAAEFAFWQATGGDFLHA